MQFLVLFDFTGRLHPAIVHLPIGILLLACLFELLTRNGKYPAVRPFIRTMVFWGALAAIAAVISGLLLQDSGEYEEEYVDPHEIVGITSAFLAIALYIFYRTNVRRVFIKTASFIVLIMIAVTGHLGGNVTRGPEFLLEPFNQSSDKIIAVKPVPDIQNAQVYNNVVQPILQEGCYNCHGPKKQKGELRLDTKDHIMKGGKEKKAVVAGKPEESEMIKRLLLPLDDEDHMPPKNKPQLSKQHIAVLQWWINTGAEFSKKVSEVKQPENIKPVLLAIETGVITPDEEITEVPEEPVNPADSAVVRRLFNNGVMVMPVARNSNYLSATFVTAANKADSLVRLLGDLKKQLVSLKLDDSNVNDSSLTTVSELTNLRRLHISNTKITDQGVAKLGKLKDLISLNLVGTQVTAKGIVALKDVKTLKYIYLYKTSITAAEREELKKNFPETILDFGNYTLPMLSGDTTEIDLNVR
ncbi:MAG: hypothetical protein JNK79_15540 [Chitinophagaceae bacterium]|nr:hypothetical protein [Chitinophagaceae bacterium]